MTVSSSRGSTSSRSGGDRCPPAARRCSPARPGWRLDRTRSGIPWTSPWAPTLGLATQVARALVEVTEPPSALADALVRSGVGRVRGEVEAAAALWRTARHAGPEAARAFRGGQRLQAGTADLIIAGLERPRPTRVLWRMRWEAMRALAMAPFRSPEQIPPVLQPPRDPRLIYVVDDDPDAREGLREQLSLGGAEVVTFPGELELLAAVAHRPPAAVLLDVVLERVDGIRLCRRLAQHPSTRGTPVYVMSGLGGPQLRRQALEAGAAEFLVKPLDRAMLARVLERSRPGQRERPRTGTESPASSQTAS